MFRRLSALRLVMLLLCLIGAQHVTLVHAFEHVPAAGVSLTAEDDGDPAHAPVCPDCLSAHSLIQLSVGAAPDPAVPDLSHVLRAASLRVAAHGAAPEPCAHGPPATSPL
ncbi:hypothetical protein [Methyloversatilis discipulorum]|uniref:hypothetical protein n=1 Tax=Methyloversatilis discipulorum TaxID=1119528 RepID=UPI00037325D7|nr:hypothetical protein [Methyloversatilis discipulorum]